jgi:NAD(P)-dependent dehydrogenase (short-subunit alcohol dehydrogenase family)
VDISNRVAVVTGGASGIGRSLCLSFADRGAAAVVVADVDAAGAAEVAAAIEDGGHRALAVPTDVASADDTQALITRAEDAFGRIDVFCSNAGIIVGGGVDLPDEAWTRMWAVNVQSHVTATRAVLPGMLARGEGYLMYTASGAGSPQAAVDGVLSADQVAALVLEAMADERFLILPHPEVATYERRRADDRERWLRGMRRLQARLSGS